MVKRVLIVAVDPAPSSAKGTVGNADGEARIPIQTHASLARTNDVDAELPCEAKKARLDRDTSSPQRERQPKVPLDIG
jgi:hypothetical protein